MQCIQWLGFNWNTSFRKICSGYFRWRINVFLLKNCLIYNSNIFGFNSQLLFRLSHRSHRVFIARYFLPLKEFRCNNEVTSQSFLKANQLEAFKSLHGRCSSWPLNQLCSFFPAPLYSSNYRNTAIWQNVMLHWRVGNRPIPGSREWLICLPPKQIITEM